MKKVLNFAQCIIYYLIAVLGLSLPAYAIFNIPMIFLKKCVGYELHSTRIIIPVTLALLFSNFFWIYYIVKAHSQGKKEKEYIQQRAKIECTYSRRIVCNRKIRY